MALFTQESLDRLRQRVDLAELLSSHMELKRAGSSYKGLCPFHEEKTPSFVLQAGDSHYHCFGCGAHGDAIAFLMNHLKMGFIESVELLAERFGVTLEKSAGEDKGPVLPKAKMKEALELATRFYHALLLHSEEGRAALRYLNGRGIDLPFIRRFRIGYAPADRSSYHSLAKGEGHSDEVLQESGLITDRGRDFFSERITFPINDPFGAVIGFSARKIREETFGGKYINTAETPLFKKSHTLFGLSYSRLRIAKEKRALIVEGQIDALRLIYEGFDFTVASQGTAFGEGHVKILHDLGVKEVILSLDADEAGRSAAEKIGHLVQKKGIGVTVLLLPTGSDPDSFLREKGKEAFELLLKQGVDYLSFLVQRRGSAIDLSVPAQKGAMAKTISEQIRSWEDPVVVHESLKKLAQLISVPESVIGVGPSPRTGFVRRFAQAGSAPVDPDRILETDLLRWLILSPTEKSLSLAKRNLTPQLFRLEICRRIFSKLTDGGGPYDLLSLGSLLEEEGEQSLLSEIIQKKVNLDKAEGGLIEGIHRLLIRKWMEEREEIKAKIQGGGCTDTEILHLAKAFDEIKKNQPQVILI